MGIVNVTPDSFSDGGFFYDFDEAIAHGLALVAAGADVLDVGGESTRPGADPVSIAEELRRVLPVIEGLAAAGVSQISIDTRNAAVMRAAVQAGATIINDVSALCYDPASLGTACELAVPVILMHAKGPPQNMQDDPVYDDVVKEVLNFLVRRSADLEQAGIPVGDIAIDPGIGFGKTLEHNLALLNAMNAFVETGRVVLLGASRKRFVAALDNGVPAHRRLGGSLAAVAAAYHGGCRFFRVHDVAETHQHLKILHAIETVQTSQ